MHRRHVAALAVAVLIVQSGLLAVHVPIPVTQGSGAISAAGTGSISVTAIPNYGYQPDAFSNLPLNATITVTFTDDDVLQHSFNISSREGFVIPLDYSASQLNQLFAQYPPLYSTMVDAQGDTSTGTFLSPSAPGWYEFVCNVTGHFQLGMYGFVAFGEALPSNLTPHHPGQGGLGEGGQSLGDIYVAIGGGVVIALALVAMLVLHRRRSTNRPPPGSGGSS